MVYRLHSLQCGFLSGLEICEIPVSEMLKHWKVLYAINTAESYGNSRVNFNIPFSSSLSAVLLLTKSVIFGVKGVKYFMDINDLAI